MQIKAAQDFLHRGQLPGQFRVPGIGHMHQQIGHGQFFQGGLKGLLQLFGQIADKPHGIHQDKLPLLGHAQAPGSGVQGGEQLVFGQHRGVGQGVEQGGFAGVGVAHQAGHGQAGLGAAGPGKGALPADVVEPPGNTGNTLTDFTAVGLQLGFTRPPAANAAGQAVHGPARGGPGQARQSIFELSQFHLQTAHAAGRVLGENIQNNLGTVQHLALGNGDQGVKLRGRKLAVEDDGAGVFP